MYRSILQRNEEIKNGPEGKTIEQYEEEYKNIESELDDEGKEGGVGVREPRKPIKPSDKDSVAISLLER
jgi:hypothetical protein